MSANNNNNVSRNSTVATMTGPSQQQQASDSAASPSPAAAADGGFVVVNLDRNGNGNGNGNGEASDLKKKKENPPKYGALGDDVELGLPKGTPEQPKHVSNASKDEGADGETVCRVCHLGLTSGTSESIVLGCACKQDLALCHRDCAEEWFRIRGNTVCEICGETAKNVHILHVESTAGAGADAAAAAATVRGEGEATASATTTTTQVPATIMSRLRYFWANQLIRNLLLATMVVVFMVPWFFRIAYF